MPADCSQERMAFEQADQAAKEATALVNQQKIVVAGLQEELNALEIQYGQKQAELNNATQELNIMEENRNNKLATSSQAYLDWSTCEAGVDDNPEIQPTLAQKGRVAVN